jgi:hypothetical protein
MAVNAYWFGKALGNALGGMTAPESRNVDWMTDTIKVMLCTDVFTPLQDTHDFKNLVTNEVVGGTYVAGGATLGGKTITYTGGTNVLKLDADDTQWPASTITARWAIIYDDAPALDADKPLLGYVDFGANFSSSNGLFEIRWNVAGMFTITVA